MRKKWIIFFIAVLSIHIGYNNFNMVCYGNGSKNKVLPISIGGIELEVELAITPEEHTRGLMHRTTLKNNEGMLFIFPKETVLSFWMKNTSIPLSIAFIKADGRIIQIESMKPYSLDTHISKEKVMYALEMKDGWFKTHNVGEGDRVKIPTMRRAGSEY